MSTTKIFFVVGALASLLLSRYFYLFFKSLNEAPTRGNLFYPMPKWLTYICALWASIAAVAFIAVILEGWLQHFFK